MNYRQYILIFILSFIATSIFAQENDLLPIVPKPLESKVTGKLTVLPGTWTLFSNTGEKEDVSMIAAVLEEEGIEVFYTKNKEDAMLILELNTNLSENAEAYSILVEESGTINVSAVTNVGWLYAMQSLRQILIQDKEVFQIPCCSIIDEPAFSWRAFMLDESRHFYGMETVKRFLDEMVRLKLNVFHWHLVDDPGWRIEIKKYPKLSTIGSKRDFSNRDLTSEEWSNQFPNKKMYYTQDEVRDIVFYAEKRGITIVPEIEMPGHASASIYAYPWLGASSSKEGKGVWGDLYNVTDPKVEKFLQNVLDEIIDLFPSGIIHIGGDEANYSHWQNNEKIVRFMKNKNIPTFSDLQVWSINCFSNYLSKKNVRMMGWNEITGDNIRNEAHIAASQSEQLTQGTIVHFWDGDIRLINKAIMKGYDVVNSNRHFTYLDYPYEVISLEKAYSFNPIPEGLNEESESKILGMGCQMWGEFTPNVTRLYYQTFPRIAAYAECGWSKPENKNYNEFCIRVKNIERRWRKLGYFNQQPSFSKQDDTFTLWQLPSQINTIGNSYVIRTDDGKIIVMDGGVKEEEGYLRGFLAAFGNKVDCWFVTHPHGDHVGALTNILLNPKDIRINQICQSTFSEELLNGEPGSKKDAELYYEAANKSGIKLIEAEPGMIFSFGSTTFKILGIKNEELKTNPYNNSCVVVKVFDPVKSVLFLADTGAEAGDKLFNGPYRNELDCDFMQMSHHGQAGVRMDFYRKVKFRACLWPTPTWVYNNDAGKGFNTHTLTTIETRNTVDELNITEQYFSFEGLTKIE